MHGADNRPSAFIQSRTGPHPLFAFLLAFLLVSPLWLSTAGTAAPAAKTGASIKPDAAVRYSKGLLWKIEVPGAKPSYLFGTIHSDDKRVTILPAPVTAAFDAASRFVMEAVIDGDGLVHMAEAMYFTDDRTLEQVIGKELYAQTLKALAAHGAPALGIEKQKPWAVMMTLSVPPPKTGEYLDLILQARATQQDKPVSGLETVQEQIAVFGELPIPDQIALLRETVRTHGDLAKDYENLIKVYLTRDLAAVMEISEKHMPDDNQTYRTVMDRLLTQRNARMAERMASLLKEGNVFLAIGAAHLPGEDGVLSLLEKAGYRVKPVY